jgi:hypothetical protein
VDVGPHIQVPKETEIYDEKLSKAIDDFCFVDMHYRPTIYLAHLEHRKFKITNNLSDNRIRGVPKTTMPLF